MILECKPDLKQKIAPHINLSSSEIYWDAIYGCDLTSGELSAVTWAHAMWTGSIWVTAEHLGCADPFERAASMDKIYRSAVARALAVWLESE